MYPQTMAPDAGMLFDFHTPQVVSFWMENTVLPLDMLFVRADGTIARVKENATPYSRENIPSGEPVEVVIELNAGRAAGPGYQGRRAGPCPATADKPQQRRHLIGPAVARSGAACMGSRRSDGRSVAQPGSASALGAEGRVFKSRRSDHT